MKLYAGSYFAFYTSDSRHWIEIDLPEPTRFTEIVTDLGIPMAEIYLVVLNGRLVESPDIIVSNEDVVKLYPAIDGG
jgi:sulfur carrier protein ThiS